jgi:hypothetical protein
MDTGDSVVHKPTGDVYLVACVHAPYLHTAGFPECRLLIADCVVKDTCSDSMRRDIIKRMAGSSGMGHRSVCARERLRSIMDEEECQIYDGWEA